MLYYSIPILKSTFYDGIPQYSAIIVVVGVGAGGVLSCPKSVIECHCHCLLFAIVLGITRVFVNYVLLVCIIIMMMTSCTRG